eukprot:TRINITY_DN8_c1_g2_i6.p1 TRINITY_DN8_c1_g2~~TRINITY_DN8_c1_g2_i6.p1  ORF type:complete len:437 (+),score=80.16 TRINITY_DN8_c1_g2_i6:509-1819(+)
MKQIIHLLLILSLVYLTLGNVTVSMPGNETKTFESLTVHYYNQSLMEFLSGPFAIQGELVSFSGSSRTVENYDVSGKIVVMPFSFGIDVFAEKFKQGGAIGLIAGTDSWSIYGKMGFEFKNPRNDFSLPTVQVTQSSYEEIVGLLDGSTFVNVTIVSNDPSANTYVRIMNDFATPSVVFGSIFFGSIFLAAGFLLFLTIKSMGCGLSLQIIILVVVMISTIPRFIYAVIDPLGSQRYASWTLSFFAQAMNSPAMVISELLVSLFWFETLKGNTSADKLYSVTKIPFIIICLFLFSMMVIFVVVSSIEEYIVNTLITILVPISMLSILGSSIFNLVTAIRLSEKIKELISLKGKTKDKQHLELTTKVIILVILDFLVILTISSIFIVVGITPLGFLFPYGVVILGGIHSIVILTLFSWETTLTSSRSKKESRNNKTV